MQSHLYFAHVSLSLSLLFRVDPKELEGRVIEHGQVIVRLGKRA